MGMMMQLAGTQDRPREDTAGDPRYFSLGRMITWRDDRAENLHAKSR
jgi:hypothetical protein